MPGPLDIYRARLRDLLASIDQGNADLASIHAELSKSIIAELRELPDGQAVNVAKLQEQFDRAFAKSLPKRVHIVRDRIEQGAEAGRKASHQTFRAVYGEDVTRGQVRASAASLRQAGERIAGRVTVDGKALGARMRGVDREVSAEMARAVQAGIRGREGILGAARKIEKLDPREAKLPAYLQELELHARNGDVKAVKNLAKSYTKRIARLGEVQVNGAVKASKYSLRAATKKFVADIKKASADGVDAIVKKYVEEKAVYRANVIARSESVESMRQAYVEQARGKRGVWGFKWTLSGRHETHQHGGSKMDVCDILAVQNVGLGAGIYPPDKVPKMPHACCLCQLVVQLRRDAFDLDEAHANDPPESAKQSKAPDAHAWLRQNNDAAARILGPTRHEMLQRGRRVLDANGAPRLVRDLLSERHAAE